MRKVSKFYAKMWFRKLDCESKSTEQNNRVRQEKKGNIFCLLDSKVLLTFKLKTIETVFVEWQPARYLDCNYSRIQSHVFEKTTTLWSQKHKWKQGNTRIQYVGSFACKKNNASKQREAVKPWTAGLRLHAHNSVWILVRNAALALCIMMQM